MSESVVIDAGKGKAQAYPLQWPQGRPRTKYREQGVFKATLKEARDFLYRELNLLGAKSIVLSTDIPLKKDGTLLASEGNPDDPGAAIYFLYKEKSMVFACDKYKKLSFNIHAIAKTIEALRGIARWGTGDMMERAFAGFLALPEASATPWREVLDFAPRQPVGEEMLNARFKSLSRIYHPDVQRTGNAERFATIVKARDMALTEIRSKADGISSGL